MGSLGPERWPCSPPHAAASSGVDIEKLAALPPSGDLTAHYVFPSYPSKQFPAGKMVRATCSARCALQSQVCKRCGAVHTLAQVEVVVGLHNDGAEAYNLTMIAGSLNSPVDFTVYVQNFSHLVSCGWGAPRNRDRRHLSARQISCRLGYQHCQHL